MSNHEEITPDESLKLLHQFALDLLQRSSLDEIFWLIADRVIAEIGFEDCVIYLLDPVENILVQKAAYGPKNPEGRTIKDVITIPFGEGIVGSVAKSAKPARIADTRLDPRYIIDDDFRLSELAVPIMLNDRCIGVIDSEHRDLDFYTQRHEELLTTIASIAATKISDAIRADELSEAVRKLEATRKVLDRQAEALKGATVNAEAANRAKSEFLATISHELRTPMNGVIGMTDLMLETELNPQQADYMGAVKTSAESLLKIINQVLDFSRIEADRLAIDRHHFKLRDLMQETMAIFSIQGKTAGLQIQSSIADDLPDDFVGDAERIRQIIVNLMGNSFKFTQEGRIDLLVRRKPTSVDGLIRLHFEVRDTGIGLPKHGIEELFSAFTQADMSSTRTYEGTGLGLAICKKLVELMGGKIWCENNHPSGCSFHFTLDLQEAASGDFITSLDPQDDQSESLDKPTENNRLSILLAEDSPVNQALMTAVLKKWGYNVVIADNGRAAVNLWHSSKGSFDLILMDVLMPECDGLTATSQIRELEGSTGNSIPIIALTALALEGDREACLKAGMNAYISKPVSRKLLQTTINQMLRSPSLADPPSR